MRRSHATKQRSHTASACLVLLVAAALLAGVLAQPASAQGVAGLPACSDEIDNDGDGHTDFGDESPNGDPDCESPMDDDESRGDEAECEDGINNDPEDTTDPGSVIDFPLDPDCESPNDDAEKSGNSGEVEDAEGHITAGGGYDEVGKEPDTNDSVNPGERLRFGAVFPCDPGDKPAGPSLNVTWHAQGGDENAQFTLDSLIYARCVDGPGDEGAPDAQFDHFGGVGSGTFRIPGGTVTVPRVDFVLRDSGEGPHGGLDYFWVRVPAGSQLLLPTMAYGFGTLDVGNVQVHKPTGPRG